VSSWHPVYHKKALDSIVYATKLANEGRSQEAEKHLQSARTFVQANADYIASLGEHKEAAEYTEAANQHIDRIQKILKKSTPAGDLKKATPQLKGPAAEAFQAKMRGEDAPMQVGHARRASEYSYKKFHELEPADQKLAHYKFGSRDMASHEYPTHPDTGKLAHAARVPLQMKTKVESYPEISAAPTLKPGIGVDISSVAGVPHRFGVVEGPSIYQPSSVNVRVGPAAHQVHAIPTMHLKARMPKNTIEKALKVLCDLRKKGD
jgi:hypothetical protein